MSSSDPNEPKTTRIEVVDALRAIAAIYVMLFHYAGELAHIGSFGVRSPTNPAFVAFTLPLMWGYNGVNLFFVISGFCIHLSYARAKARSGAAQVRWGKFAKKRFWRLYPTHLFSVVLAVLVIAGWPRAPFPIWQTVGHLLFLQPFSATLIFGLNPVFWSLGVEIHFYLLYPIFLWLRERFGAVPVLAGSFGLGLAGNLLLVGLHPERLWLITLSNFSLIRWSEWILGCVLAEITTGRVRRPFSAQTSAAIGAVLFPVAMCLRPLCPSNFMLPNFVFSAAYASLMLPLLVNPSLASRGGRPLAALAWIGTFSYSIYLVHACLTPAVAASIRQLQPRSVPMAWAVVLAWSAVGLCASYAFFALFERPFLASSAAVGSVVLEPAARRDPAVDEQGGALQNVG